MTETQRHHVYPRYLTNRGEVPPWGDSNIVVEVSLTQHAMFHWCNYQLWGNEEDKLAWRLLAGFVGNNDIFTETRSLGGKSTQRKRENDPEFDALWKRLARENMLKLKARRGEDPDFNAKCLEACRRNGKTVQERRELDPELDRQFRENAKKGVRNREKRRAEDPNYAKRLSESSSNNAKSYHNRRRNDPELDSLHRRACAKGGSKSKGKKAINKSGKLKKVHLDELPKYLSEGWNLGGLSTKRKS